MHSGGVEEIYDDMWNVQRQMEIKLINGKITFHDDATIFKITSHVVNAEF